MTKRRSSNSEAVSPEKDVSETNRKKKHKKEPKDTKEIVIADEKTELEESGDDDIGSSDNHDDYEVKDRFPNSIPVKKTKKKNNRKIDTDDQRKPIEKMEPNPDQRIKLALKYLKKWHKHRDEWKFQKVRQLCLLQYMYDQTRISDKKFKSLLGYISGMTGAAREKTIKDAGKILVENDESEDEDSEKLNEIKLKVDRATEILQVLS